jgi:hypothetical protein
VDLSIDLDSTPAFGYDPSMDELLSIKEKRAAYSRAWAAKNKDKRRETCRRWRENHPGRTAEIQRAYRRRNIGRFNEKQMRRFKVFRKRIDEVKAVVGCILCGEREPCCLDFHHRNPKTKSFIIAKKSRGVCTHAAWERLQKEIAKCVVLCRNCHARVHHFGLGLPS